MLVSQETPHVEVYERQADGSWALREETRLEGAVALPGASVSLPLAEIYDRIDFPVADRRPRPPRE